MTRMHPDDLAAIRTVVREEIRAFHQERLAKVMREPSDDDLAAIRLKLTNLGLRAVGQPVAVETDNVVAFRFPDPDPDHSPPSPPPSAA